MKYINKIIMPVALGLLLTAGVSSCSKSFLDVTPKGEFTVDHKTPDQAFAALTAAYSLLNSQIGGWNVVNLGAPNSAGDDCYAGGGGPTDMYKWQVLTRFNLLQPGDGSNNPGEWNIFFMGVKNSNLLLTLLEGGVPGLSADLAKRYTAECKFLRAHYYFDLVRWYGNVPLFTEAVTDAQIPNVTNSNPEVVYAQIKSDLLAAIPDLPQTVSGSELGRAYQGSAEAELGKVLLTQASLHKNGVILKQDPAIAKLEADSAIVYLSDVNGDGLGVNSVGNKFGYKLQQSYRGIFDPSNKFNSESVFEIQMNSEQVWDKSNVYAMMRGPRGFIASGPNGICPPQFAASKNSGWSFNPITPDLYQFMTTPNNGFNGNTIDPRYGATIQNIDSVQAAGYCSYSPGYMNTGLFVGKYANLDKWASAITNNFGQDFFEIRLADTYLMESEAQLMCSSPNMTRALLLVNSVRERVSLPDLTSLTLTNIQNERRAELATEGHRYFDLVRWGIAAQVLNNMQPGPTGSGFTGNKGYVAPKNYLLPIPLNDLTNTKLVQNPGY